MRYLASTALLFVLLSGLAQAADSDSKLKIKGIRDFARNGPEGIAQIAPYLVDADVDVRLEAVKQITILDTQRSLDPLIRATNDTEGEVQTRAVEGLVNFYVPGFVKTGMTGRMQRAGTAIKTRFTDTNNQVIEPFVQVRPDVVSAVQRVIRAGATGEAQSTAARAAGIFRARAAVPELVQALHAKDSSLIYESLVALRKINDPSAGPEMRFLLRDLDERVQLTAIETSGLLHDQGAVTPLRDILDRNRSAKVKKAALTSLSELPDTSLHSLFITYLSSKDEAFRQAAAEGLARLRDPADQTVLHSAFTDELKAGPRLADAFALVYEGDVSMAEAAPLKYLVDALNSSADRSSAIAYLAELAHISTVQGALRSALQDSLVTRAEKTGIAEVFGDAGTRDTAADLETLSKDPDSEVAQAGLKALRTLNSRM